MDDFDETQQISGSGSYAVEPDRGMDDGQRVIWGRIVVLVVALLLAFFMGRACSPGVSTKEHEELRQELAEAKAELASKKAAAAATPSPSPTPAASPSPSPTEQAQTYVVRPGDTLAEIAVRFYKNARLDDFLAETNKLADKTKLTVGQRLTIPPKPGASPSPTTSPSPSPSPTR